MFLAFYKQICPLHERIIVSESESRKKIRDQLLRRLMSGEISLLDAEKHMEMIT